MMYAGACERWRRRNFPQEPGAKHAGAAQDPVQRLAQPLRDGAPASSCPGVKADGVLDFRRAKANGHEVLVHHLSGVDNQAVLRIGHDSCASLQLMLKPHVVLITEGKQLTGTERCRPKEVRAVPKTRLILVHMDWKGRLCSKLMKDVERAIRRSVIAGDQFTGQQRLPGQAVELLLQKAIAVICRHRYGYPGFIHRHFLPVAPLIHIENPESITALVRVLDDLPVPVPGPNLTPEIGNATHSFGRSIYDIVKGDQAAFSHQRRVHFEISLDALVAMIAVNKKVVERLAPESSLDAPKSIGGVRIALDKM